MVVEIPHLCQFFSELSYSLQLIIYGISFICLTKWRRMQGIFGNLFALYSLIVCNHLLKCSFLCFPVRATTITINVRFLCNVYLRNVASTTKLNEHICLLPSSCGSESDGMISFRTKDPIDKFPKSLVFAEFLQLLWWYCIENAMLQRAEIWFVDVFE